jgi:hypothetical protein
VLGHGLITSGLVAHISNAFETDFQGGGFMM